MALCQTHPVAFLVCPFRVGAIRLGVVSRGLLQGFAQFDVASTFRSSIEFVAPFRFLTALSSVLLLVANLSFAFSFVLMLLKLGKSQSGPALLNEPTENSLETLAV